MVTAKLPESRVTPLIKDLEVGESGYTVPWAMECDLDRSLWINTNYTIDDKAGGTVQMHLTRVREGFIVDIRNCDHTWTPRSVEGRRTCVVELKN